MSIYEEIDNIYNNLMQNESRLIAKAIRIYSEGVKAKLKHAEFALSNIEDLSPLSDDETISEDQIFYVSEKIQFYADSFFAFLYSIFDILSQVINQKYKMGLDEKLVSFNCLKNELHRRSRGTPIERLFNKLPNKRFFKNLDRYRNCSTHRREICIITTTVSGTSGYDITGDIPLVSRILCENPLSLNPKIKQGRELVKYCTDMFDKVKSEMLSIFNNI